MKNMYSLNNGIELRLAHPLQAENLYSTLKRNRKSLITYMDWLANLKTQEDVELHLTCCANLQHDGTEMTYYIFEKDTIIGCISLHQIHLYNQSASLGYWLVQKKQGKGIIHHTLSYLLNLFFERLNLNRIEILTHADNIKSMTTAQRLGFTAEGVLRQVEKRGDNFSDLMIYSILKNEWLNKITS